MSANVKTVFYVRKKPRRKMGAQMIEALDSQNVRMKAV